MKDILFKFLAWSLTLPLLLGAIAFALFNREDVDILYTPFGSATPLPVFVPVLTAIAFGFLFGALMTWAAHGRQRAKLREQGRKITALEKQLEEKNASAYKYHNAAITTAPLLEKRP